MEQILCYCKKCGRKVFAFVEEDKARSNCDICNSELYPIPEEYLGGMSKSFIKKELEEEFIEKYIKSAPEFDQSWFDRRDGIMERKDRERAQRQAWAKARERGPHCPYCGCSNIGRIGGVSRAISVGMFGMASGKIGKTHKCRSCGGMW
ncbi:MAG: hypothetical protein HFH41_00470 [Lachnospiraceae bacterium]|nr:hypothetical protein [Lachnospiraceae bacterium]